MFVSAEEARMVTASQINVARIGPAAESVRSTGVVSGDFIAAAMRTMQPSERWVQQQIPGGWTAAFRISAQAGGFVVSEIRVYPEHREPGVPIGFPGLWPGSFRSVDDDPIVPVGGITSKVLRAVRAGAPQEAGMECFREEGAASAIDAAPPSQRRDAVSDVELARLSRDYVAALRRQQPGARLSPVQYLAARYELPLTTVRGRIHLARKRGLLGATLNRQGKAGGQLTPKAEALLSDARTPKRSRVASSRPAPRRRGPTKR
jgi:hypothetical protein